MYKLPNISFIINAMCHNARTIPVCVEKICGHIAAPASFSPTGKHKHLHGNERGI